MTKIADLTSRSLFDLVVLFYIQGVNKLVNMFFYCRSFLKGPVDHRIKVTLPLTTFHSLQLLVNACCPHLRQHHLTVTLRVVCVPGLRTGLTGLTGQDTGVLLVVFSLVLALTTHQAHVSMTFGMYR